jgi:geranylgeranyl diphosphate synthase type II
VKKIEALKSYFEDYLESQTFPDDPEHLYDSMRYILSLGGKRLRPIAVLLVADAFNKLDDNALHAALAVEHFHNFSLIHDDIMDASNLRRGKPTVHKKYDTNTAILSGDGLLIKAYESLNRIEHNKTEILNLFNKTSIEVCEGQQMDMNFESRDDVTIDEYINMIKLKTAVLIGCAFQLGGLVGNVSTENLLRLYQVGMNLGIAFQIMDDYLDAYSTQTGKK